MLLRHAREPIEGVNIDDTFEAIDEHSGATLGRCSIFTHESGELFPNRPIRIYMDIEGDPAPDALLGAAVARAKELAMTFQAPSRIFTQVLPEDRRRMDSLRMLGFKDSDGLICMRRDLPCEQRSQLPIGCVIVRDDLDDPIEQKYFLERYNQLYNEAYDFEWLHDFRAQAEFERILIVAPTGMAGECICWREGEVGRIGWLYVSRKWRGMGVSRCLLDVACADFETASLSRVEAEIQARIPGLLHVMESAHFRQAELILRYPGIDVG